MIDNLDKLCAIAIAIAIAVAAGQEVMAVYNHGGVVWKKEDTSPLTEADLRADALIRFRLETEFPGIFILSEESASDNKLTSENFFLVDPLDGTKEFLKRNGEFTVNIALISDGVPVAGVVFAPALDELFFAAANKGSWKSTGAGIFALHSSATEGAVLRIVGSRSHGSEQLATWLQTLKRQHNFTAAGSSLKFCRLAEGFADIYPRFGPTSQWDTAAAQCVLEQAGGCVVDLEGNRLRYGMDRPILNPKFFALATPALVALI